MHEVLVNRLGGLSLPRKSVVRLTDRPHMTLDVYCGRKTTKQQQNNFRLGASSVNEKPQSVLEEIKRLSFILLKIVACLELCYLG